MTEQQQQIVDLLIAEFNKSNKPTSTGFARIAEATSEIDEWLQFKKRVLSINDAWDDARDARIHADCDSLIEQIASARVPVCIRQSNGYIELDCEGRNVEESIMITYYFKSKYHQPAFCRDSITEYQGVTLVWNGDHYDTIEDMFNDERFFRRWTQLVNKSILINGRK